MKKAVSSGLSSKNGDTNSISNTCKTDGDKLSIKYSSSSDDEKGSRLRKPYSLKTPINKNGSSLVHQTPVTVNENKSTTQRSCVISSGLQSYNDNTCKSISTDLSDTSSDYKTSKKIQKPRQKLMRHAFGSREKQRPKIRYHAEESATSESDSGSDDYIVPSKYRRRMIKRSTDADDQHRNSKTDGSESDGIKSSHSTLIKAAVVDVVKTVCVKEDKGRAESINEEETTSTSTSPGPIEECQNNFLKICYEEHRSETINMGGEPDTMNMGGEPEAGTELVGPNSNALIEVSNALTDTPLSIGGADGEFRDGDLAITPYEYTGQKITPLCCQKIQVEKTNLSGWPHEGEKKHNERSSPTNGSIFLLTLMSRS
jgi:hypothetical protein